MSSFLSELGGITAGVGAEGLAFAAGFAASHALTPEATLIGQDAWHGAQTRRINAELAAAIAAEDIARYDVLADEATYSGIDASRFAYLYHVNLTAPGTGELLNMLRRGTINHGNFTHGLRKNKLEPMWDAAIAELADQKISATDLAYMIVRGVLPDEGLLPGNLPTQADNLQLPPQLSLNPVTEAQKTGWDQERLAAMVARSGLAMAPVMAAQARFRKILTQNDYLLTIARGDLFPAYADPVLEVSRQILTAEQAAELQLRGYIDRATRLDLTRLHGMTDANSDHLYDVLGRGLNLHSAFIAERRGGVFKGDTSAIPDWALWMLQRGNLRPEVYNLAWTGRHTLPSAFVIRSLLRDGAISADRGETLFLHSGWPEDLAKLVANHYAPSGATVADPHVTKAGNQLWTTTHKSYVGEMIDPATATTALGAVGVSAAAIPAVLNLWNEERSLIRKQLSPAQVKKAYHDGIYTQAEAMAALLARGYDQADATTLLAE